MLAAIEITRQKVGRRVRGSYSVFYKTHGKENNKMTKVVCFGSINIDHVYAVDHMVQRGETISSQDVQDHCGGKGLNQSIALAKAGQPTWMAGGVGESDGQEVLAILEKNGVDTSLIEKRPGKTGHTVIQVDKTGNNAIVLCGAANHLNSQAYIEEVLDHFKAGDWVVMQNEINLNGNVFAEAHKRGLKVCMNPSPFTPDLKPLCAAELLFVNELEAASLCGEKDPMKVLAVMHEKYPSTLAVVTLGENGSAAVTPSGAEFHQKAYACHAVDTTGAGDTFTGYFLAEYIRSKDVASALQLASAASSLSVRKPGAAESIPLLEEVKTFLEEI